MIQRLSGDAQIAFDQSDTANAPTLILLHAFPLSRAMWNAQLEHFSSRFRVVAPDARGVGESSPFAKAPAIEQMARDLAALLDALAIERAIVGGCSMGGYTALEFVRQFPQRVRGLILCDTRADADSPEAKATRNEMISFALAHDGAAIADKMLPKLLACPVSQTAEQVRNCARSVSSENAARLIQCLRDRRDSSPILRSIAVPTLVIGGRHDVPSPPDIMAQMAASINGAKHVVLEDAGHLSSLEQSGNWNREVDLWLEESELSSGSDS